MILRIEQGLAKRRFSSRDDTIVIQVEVKEKSILVRDMKNGKQWNIPLGSAVAAVRALLHPEEKPAKRQR